jgi:hypothetical protein
MALSALQRLHGLAPSHYARVSEEGLVSDAFSTECTLDFLRRQRSHALHTRLRIFPSEESMEALEGVLEGVDM